MRILFVGGMYRGLQLAQRLIERREQVVGAFVYEEDLHENPKYCDVISHLWSSNGVWTEKACKIPSKRAIEIRDRLAPDVILCMGWRTLIPNGVLRTAPMGMVAVHDSLLPKLRGFAPTNWGLLLGHDQLGATLFQVTGEIDSGDIYFQAVVEPEVDETFTSLQEKIAIASVELFDQFLDAAKAGTLCPRAQLHQDATYTCARIPEDGEIDWRHSSESIARTVRALTSPAPGAFTYYDGKPVFILEAASVPSPRNYEGRIAGRLIDRNPGSGTVDVLCGSGVLRICRVRLSNGDELTASEVFRSIRKSLGMNYSQEIARLRDRVEVLEQRVAEQLQRKTLDEELSRASLA